MTRRGLARPLAGLLAGIACALTLAAGDATAAPSWSRPQTIARPTCPTKVLRGLPPTQIVDLHAVQNARGDRLVAWIEQCPRGWRVVATSQPPGGRFGPPRILDRMHGGHWSVQLAATLNARGGAIVAWAWRSTATSHENARVLVAMRAPQRRFDPSRLLDRRGGEFALAANARGEAVLAWKHQSAPTGAVPVVVAALHRAGAPRFDGRQRLSAPLVDVQNAFGGHDGIHPTPTAAVADDGSAIVAWRRADASAPDCCSAVEATMRAPGAPFAPAVRVSAPYKHNPVTGPTVAIADDRTAYVAWITNEYGVYPTPGAVTATHWDGSAFAPPAALFGTTGNVRPSAFVAPGILLAHGGAALAQWISYADLCSPAAQFGARFDGATIPLDPSAPVQTSSLVPTDRLYAGYARALDRDGHPVTAWFDGRAFAPDRYGCQTLPTALAGSVDGGQPIAGPRVADVSAFDLSAAPGPTPTMVWAEPRRIRLAELSGT
jgi:hypothetical protein